MNPFILLPILGAIMTPWGFFWLYKNIHLLRNGEKTIGRVIAIESEMDTKNRRRYVSKIEFTAADGKRYAFLDQASSNKPLHQVGDRVEIMHEIGKPEAAQISNAFRNYVIPLLLSLLGVMFLLAPYIK